MQTPKNQAVTDELSDDLNPSEIPDVLGPYFQLLTPLLDDDSKYCVIRSNFPAEVVVPIRGHPDRETSYILAGELEGLWEDHWITLRAGDFFDVRSDLKHAWRNVSGAPASLLIVTTMRQGRFLRDIGRPIATVLRGKPTPAVLQRFSKIVNAYGFWSGSRADNSAVGIRLDNPATVARKVS